MWGLSNPDSSPSTNTSHEHRETDSSNRGTIVDNHRNSGKVKTGKVRFGCRIFHNSTETIGQLVRRAQFCEKQGFDSVFVDDHLLYGTREASAPDAFSVLALLASQTRKIRLGIAVTDLVRRHPAIVAQAIATLNSASRGRIFLGLGAGDPMNQAPFGIPTDHRFTRLREGLRILRLLWDSSFENPKNFRLSLIHI